MTVYEQIKSMTIDQMATMLATMYGQSLVGASKFVYFGGFMGSLGLDTDSPFEKQKAYYLEILQGEDAEKLLGM